MLDFDIVDRETSAGEIGDDHILAAIAGASREGNSVAQLSQNMGNQALQVAPFDLPELGLSVRDGKREILDEVQHHGRDDIELRVILFVLQANEPSPHVVEAPEFESWSSGTLRMIRRP